MLSHHVLAFVLLAPAAPVQGGFQPCTRVLHTLAGEAPRDNFGWVSAPVSDIDGDGVPELLVGAPFHDSAGANAGRIYLYDGRTGALRFRADGGAAADRLGFAVRDAGDLDGDGVGDVIAGGRGGTAVAGAVRVFSGASGALLLTFAIGQPGDSFGYSVTGIGDVNDDGTPDLAVGAPDADPITGANAGIVRVVSGADGSTVLAAIFGELPGDSLGTSLSNLGDVTGDGRPELAIGAANAGPGRRGKAYVHDLALGIQLYAVLPETTGAEFGQFFIAAAGRVDGDGFPDLYVGDFADDMGRGRAYLFSGVDGAPLRTLVGQRGDGFGIGRPIGDLNGDGRDDLLLGSYTDSTGASGAGKAEVFSGADGTLLRRVSSTTANENFGFDAHGLGDVDGDGVNDLVVTAASFGNGRGRVYVIADRPIESFGVGLAGSGGFEPRLELTDCPQLGSTITFQVSSGRGGAIGLLVASRQRIDRPTHGGILFPAPDFCFLHRLAGPGRAPGAGTAALSFLLPSTPSLVGRSFTTQAAYLDAGAFMGVSFTQALRLTLY